MPEVPNAEAAESPESQSDMLARIENAIQIETRHAIRDLHATLEGDEQSTLVLKGRCSSYYAKQLAQGAVFPLVTGFNFRNDIEVTS